MTIRTTHPTITARTAKATRSRASVGAWSAFVAWYRRRPFVGGVLTILAGVEIFFSGQLDLGNIHIQVGIEGLQATILPIILVVLGLASILAPTHRIFYGVISLALSVYSLIGVNLGGFFIGMLLGSIGGIMVVSWAPRKIVVIAAEDSAAEPRPFVQSRA